jgi:chromosome partitioning protein
MAADRFCRPAAVGAQDEPRRSQDGAAGKVAGVSVLGRTIAVANQKGGVGKTTTTVNLGACLASLGKQILCVDLDPQGHTSVGLGVEKERAERTVYHLLMGRGLAKDYILPTAIEGLAVLPANLQLAGAEVELLSELAREVRLRDALAPVKDLFDYVLIDCPPSLGQLTVNALAAADSVIVPVQGEYYSLEGLALLLNTIRAIKERLNPQLRLEGVLLTMFDGRTNLGSQVADDVRKHFGDRVYKVTIPRNVRLSEAPSHGEPIIQYDPRSRGAEAYLELAKEVITHAEAGSGSRAGGNLGSEHRRRKHAP